MFKKMMNMCWYKILLFQWKIVNLLVLKILCSNFDHNYFKKFVMTLQELCQHFTMKQEYIDKDFLTEMKISFFVSCSDISTSLCKRYCTIFEENSYYLLRQIKMNSTFQKIVFYKSFSVHQNKNILLKRIL